MTNLEGQGQVAKSSAIAVQLLNLLISELLLCVILVESLNIK